MGDDSIIPVRSIEGTQFQGGNTQLSTLEIIVGLMHKRLSLATEQLRPEQTLEELGVDSLALVEFMFDVEDALNIRFDDERVVVTTVQDVVNLVDLALEKQNSQLKLQPS